MGCPTDNASMTSRYFYTETYDANPYTVEATMQIPYVIGKVARN
tara:strand:- start:106 stop:237 length:132 start_codon:yes stop_codon:yes gene_type:complete